MDDLINDIEEGIPYSPPRSSNKKMKKRKQLNALLKFRSSKINQTLRSSEDELFLPDQKTPQTKHSSSSSYRRWYNYTRHILSFCLVCIFMIVCVGLAYANIELKHEVQNLSSRVTEIEKTFTNSEINRVISSIEQIKTRLNLIERWNMTKLYDRLHKLQTALSTDKVSVNDEEISSKLESMEQKTTQFSEVASELDKLSHDADNQVTEMVTEKSKTFDRNLIEHLLEQERRENAHQDVNQLAKTILSFNQSLHENTLKWSNDMKSLRNDIENLNQSVKIEELTNIVQNSSDRTSAIANALQTDLEKLRQQIEACKCTKESVFLKPSIVDSEHLQQSLVTKPSQTSSDSSVPNETIKIAQIVNRPPSIP